MNGTLQSQGSIIDASNWLAQIVLFPSKYHRLLYSFCLYSNTYSNAGELQRKRTTHYGQNSAVSSTGRTWANTSGQGVSSPPFGMPSKILGPPVQLKSLVVQLERICDGVISYFDSNLTANVTHNLSPRTSMRSPSSLRATLAPKVRQLPKKC